MNSRLKHSADAIALASREQYLCHRHATVPPRAIQEAIQAEGTHIVENFTFEKSLILCSKQANLHHYLEHMDSQDFCEASESLLSVIHEYDALV
jgi:hypothetical protein